ncbi:toxin-antitoxin system YwqK family antitoxin [Roseivirga misakiensis]|nr:toxin-antitoxin system YwqK family antitoxin [Roseivirga misakiensis]
MRSIRVLFGSIFLTAICAFGLKYNSVPKSHMVINKVSLELNAQKGLFLYNNEPFTGTALSLSTDSIAMESASFLKGKRHGQMVKFFVNGSKSYEANYKWGKLDGKVYSWWKNGQKRSESTFEEGVLNGVQKKWYQSGALFKETNLIGGKESGLQRAWRENGKLYVNYEAKNGRIYGLKRSTLCYQLNDEVISYED